MRIDVQLEHRDMDAELAALHARLRRAGGVQQLPIRGASAPEFVFSFRESDGEFHVYVEDSSRGVLAGCTVFQRVLEVDRRAGRYVRSPHSRYGAAYRRRGLASSAYRWALGAGLCLVSGPRQSPAAHRLWWALGRSHDLLFVRARDKRLEIMDGDVEPSVFDQLETRMLLLGAGWTRGRLAAQTCASGA